MIPMWKTEEKDKQAHSGKGLAAKRHKLTVKCHYSQALGKQDTQEQTLGSFQSKEDFRKFSPETNDKN